MENLEQRQLLSAVAVGLWHFDETGGTSAADSSSYGNTASLQGSASFVSGHSGNAVSLTGSVGTYASAPNATNLNPTGGITLGAWINATSWGSGNNRRILQKGSNNNQYRLLDNSNALTFDLTGVGSISASLPSTGVWHYVAGTYDGSLMRLYVDGTVVASANKTGSISTTSDGLLVGAKTAGDTSAGDFFNGLIDDAEVDNGALSVAQVVAKAGSTPTAPSTPTNVGSTAISSTAIRLTWNSPDNNQDTFAVQELLSGTWTTLSTQNANARTYTVSGLSAATAHSFRIVASNSQGDTASGTISLDTFDASLPSPWSSGDIGSPSIGGFSGYDSLAQSLTVNGGGSDIGGTGDQFQYLYQSFSGDGSVIAHIASQTNSNTAAKAGVMIRQSLAANAANFAMLITPSSGGSFQYRSTAGGSTTSTYKSAAVPEWVKLTRSGNRIAGYVSADGQNWSYAGSASFSMGDPLYFGLVSSGHSSSSASTAVFDHVSVAAPAALPSPWQSADVGDPVAIGSASFDSGPGTFNLAGAGTEITGTSDQFRYAYQTLSGDGTITAFVASQSSTYTSAKTGVMIRQSLDAGSAHVMMALTPSSGTSFRYRSTSGGNTTNVAGPSVAAPYWVRLVRSGGTVRGYVSVDGQGWALVGSVDLSFSGSVDIGLAVSSHDASNLCQAALSNVTVSNTAMNLPVAPGHVAASAIASDALKVDWLNQATDATGNQVQVSTDGVNFTTVATTAANVDGTVITGLNPNSTYTVRVGAVNSSGSAVAATTSSTTSATAQLTAYRVTAVGSIQPGEYEYGSSGSMNIANSNWIVANSWQEAVYLAITGSASCEHNQVSDTFPGGAFKLFDNLTVNGTSVGKAIGFENRYGSPLGQCDYDYNDAYFTVSVETRSSLDLDADSDNNAMNGVPDRSQAEDSLEESAPGKWIAANGNLSPSNTSHRFVPLVLDRQVDVSNDPAKYRLTFNEYTGSGSGLLRIWKVDGTQNRASQTPLHSGQSYTASQLGFSAGTSITLYMEAVNSGADNIVLSYDPAGGSNFVDGDTVRYTAIDEHVTCLACLSGTEIDQAGHLLSAGSDASIGGIAAERSGTADGRDTAHGNAMHLVLTGNGVAILQNDQVRIYDDIGGTLTPRDPRGGTIALSSGEYVETDSYAVQRYFSASAPLGKLDNIVDPENTTQYAFDGQGRISGASQVVGNVTNASSYSYDGQGRVSQTLLTRQVSGGNAQTIRTVSYGYYGSDAAGGAEGDLATVTVRDAGSNTLQTTYYRYYKAGQANGFEHGLKYVLYPEAYQRLVAAVGNATTATDSQVAAFADDYFEYDSQQRVTKRTSAGTGCSTCGNGLGSTTYSYATSGFADGVNAWKNKVTATLPDGAQQITFYNYRGQSMLDVTVAGGQQRITYHRFDSNGNEILTAEPSAVTGYSESAPDLVNYQNGNAQYLADSAGKIDITDYYSTTSGSISDTVAGGVFGYTEDQKIQHGETGTPILLSSEDYYAHAGGGSTVYNIAHSTVYANTDGTGARTTSYGYSFATNSTHLAQLVTTQPPVTAAHNGPASSSSDTANADTTTEYFDQYGRAIWSKDGDGHITYSGYDDATGALVKSITDVDYSQLSSAEQASFDATGWDQPGGLNLVSTYVVDDQGRTTKSTDPAGHVTYSVYKDTPVSFTGGTILSEIRTYSGWNGSTHAPTGPIQISREIVTDDGSGNTSHFSESLGITAAPALDGSNLPTGDETFTASDITSLSRSYYNEGGQLINSDAYFDLTGMAYSTAANVGTAGTNYYRTAYAYDENGRQNRAVSPTGTISRTVYDGFGRTASTWVGTNDTPTSGEWSPTNNTGTSNMVEVSSNQYDNGGAGDGNLTRSIQYPGGSAENHVTDYFYDWRDRQVASKSGVKLDANADPNPSAETDGVHRPIGFAEYDNLDEVVTQEQFDGDGVTITSSDGVPQAPSASLLRVKSTNEYDEQARVFASHTFAVDPIYGTVSTASLDSQTWFDHRGNQIKSSSSGSAVSKSVYDGAGRVVKQYTTDGGGDSTWADAGNVAGDIVLTQGETQYDAGGSPIFSISKVRLQNATGTGELDGTTARISYSASYYDPSSGRLTDSVNVGTNGGSTYARPSTVPTRSDSALVTSYGYNTAGEPENITDPKGIVSHSDYDLLGQTTRTIKAYNQSDSTPSDATNQTTEYTFDGDGHTLTMTAVLPGGAYQTTEYVYGVDSSTGSAIASNDLLRRVKYPDETTGSPSSSASDQQSFTYDALGEQTGKTDQNGTIHACNYDVLGRKTADEVTTLGASVDGATRKLTFTYNTQGLPYELTSYNASDDIVNQLRRQYNGLGQMTIEWQEHSGAVNTSTTPEVQYGFSDLAHGSRLVSMTYPNGREIDFHYASGLDDTISRLSSITDSSGTLESYTYLGDGTVLERIEGNGTKLTYLDSSGNITGLDDFGRVVDQKWVDSSDTAIDEYTYTYDRDGNRTSKANSLNSDLSETYSYDDLSRLTGVTRDGTAHQSWDLDALGNSDSVTTDSTPEARDHNAQNQLTDMGGNTLAYDNNGNETTDQNGWTFVYDAWNRQVEVKNGESTLVRYAFDAAGRRIIEGDTQVYWSDQWQRIEDRNSSGDPTAQYVYSPVYVDAFIERDRSVSGTLDERVSVMQDANYDVTGLADDAGVVAQRFFYDAYGSRTVADASTWTETTDAFAFQPGHQGGFFDPVTGKMYFRNRIYDADSMRWMQKDPLGSPNAMVAGPDVGAVPLTAVRVPAGLMVPAYEAVGDNPLGRSDPTGLYERNFHRGVIYYLHRAACWSPLMSRLVASMSQVVDDDPRTDPVKLGAEGLFQNMISFGAWHPSLDLLAKYHFPGSKWNFLGMGGSKTRAGDRDAARSLAQAYKPFEGDKFPYNSLIDLGVALHAYADSFSHDGYSAYPALGVDIGHWWVFTSADKTSKDVQKALRAANSIFSMIPRKGSVSNVKTELSDDEEYALSRALSEDSYPTWNGETP